MKINLKSTPSAAGIPGRVLWILLSRLITYGLLFAASAIFLQANDILNQVLIVYGLLAIGLLVYLYAYSHMLNGRLLRIIIGIQLVFEFAIESILINHAGGNFSPLIVLFILSIVSATLLYGLLGTLLAATAAGLFYAAPIILDFSKILPDLLLTTQLTKMGFSSDEVFYTVFLHLCMFYLIAFISGYMAQRQIFTSRELRKIKLETDEILENMSSGMVTVDSTGNLLYFNKIAGEILGVNPAWAKKSTFKTVLFEKFPELYYKIELAMTAGYTESRGEINIKNNDTVIPLGISTSILKDDNNEIRGVIAVFQNLAEAKLMEKKLRDADRMATVGQLSAGIAHEIRNPLASISGSVEVLKSSLELSDEQDKRLLELIIKETSRLNEILTEFLSFARIKSNFEILSDIPPIIDEVITLAKAHPDFKENIEIVFNHPPKRIYGVGGPDLYKQLLWNLLLNGFQAMSKDGGKITVTCDRYIARNGKVFTKLSVDDTGPGVPPKYRDKIFDPFFSTKSYGTGLGLAIVSRIVESLEGKLEFDTNENGTIFEIYLPLDSMIAVSEKAVSQNSPI